MPLRAPKMYGFIFGFQRFVWCPKWTPASSSCFMVMALPCVWRAAFIASEGAAWVAPQGALVDGTRQNGTGFPSAPRPPPRELDELAVVAAPGHGPERSPRA